MVTMTRRTMTKIPAVLQHLGHRATLKRLACTVFFDFDNTITPFDVLDGLIQQFAVDEAWIPLQKAWEAGVIGSKACLTGQLRSVCVSPASLASYLSTVTLDPYFKPLVALFRALGVEPVIVSDNFSLIVNRILRHHEVRRIPVYANRVRLVRNRLIPAFPFAWKGCTRGCAHCKQQHLIRRQIHPCATIYVGNGLSDLCPADVADVVFARGLLLRYCRKTGRPCVPFDTLKDVYTYIKEVVR